MNLRTLTEPRLITWAALTADIDALARRLRAQGDATAVPRDGSRSRPDGCLLKWRTLAVQTDLAAPEVNPIPFFIEWAPDSAHPSQDAPVGCELTAFEGEHPTAEALRARLTSLGVDVVVREATDVALVATLETPRGRVVLR